MRSLAVIALLVAAATTVAGASRASAQPGIAAPLAPPSSVDGPPPPRAKARTGPGAYRPAAAFFLSFGASLAVYASAVNGGADRHPRLTLGAFVLAPATGRWYVGQIGVPGLAMRLGGLVLIAAAFEDQSIPLLVTGGTLAFGSIFYDAIGAAHHAHKQNQRRWAAMPTVVASPRGELAPGVALSGSF